MGSLQYEGSVAGVGSRGGVGAYEPDIKYMINGMRVWGNEGVALVVAERRSDNFRKEWV